MGAISFLYGMRWMLATVIGVIYLANKIRVYRRLSAFKGPFSAGFSDAWNSFQWWGLKFHWVYEDLCNKYGTIVRVGPNHLITSSHELLVHMSAARSQYTRAPWFYESTRFEPGKNHIFSFVDEEKHNQRRNQMAAGYSGKENLALEGPIDQCIGEFIHLIRTKYLSTPTQVRAFDFARKTQFFTLDVISLIAYGEAFGDLRTDSDVNSYLEAGEHGMSIIAFYLSFGLMWLFENPLVTRFLAPSEKDSIGIGKMIASARAIIKARFKQDNLDQRSDMIASFARHGMTLDEICTEATFQIIAGSDTTAMAIQTIILYIVSHPRVYNKLQAEIDAVKVQDTAGTGIIQDAQAKTLPYLTAVIKEAMRIHPSVSVVATKRAPDEGDKVVIEGKSVFLPGGTFISAAMWPLAHSKDVFGPDADVFRPERWLLETDRDRLAVMNRVLDLGFGHGRYQCLGKFIGVMEIHKCVFELIRNFDWSLARPQVAWRESNYAGVLIHSDMWMLATDRE